MPTPAIKRILDAPARELKEALAGAIADARVLNKRTSLQRKRGEAGTYAQRAAYLSRLDEAFLDFVKLALAQDETRRALVALAKLASPEPMFDNPIIAWEAQRLRDEILRDAGLIGPANTGAVT